MSDKRRFVLSTVIAAILLVANPVANAVTRVTCNSPLNAQQQPTEYFISLADNVNHLAHVSIRFTRLRGPITLNMPVWNALYEVRDFAANIENVRAFDASGRTIAITVAKTSEWQMAPPTACAVVEYDIHLAAAEPFGSELNVEHAFFNWAMVLMYSPATRSQSTSVQLLDVPPNWSARDVHVLGYAPAGKVEQAIGLAHNYDELVDSPVEVGVFQQFDYQQDGAAYHVVVHAGSDDYDSSKLQDILRAITHAEPDWMSDRPFDEYTFLYHFPRGHGAGGMEHGYGTAIDVNADRLRSNIMPVASISAHEFFHLWNVKRIRPQSLEPIEYQHAMDTRALWFSEGVTSTVGDMILARAGLMTDREYIDRVASEINELQTRPAHAWQSAEDSSLEAWFEGDAYYRSPQRSVSYYNKGEVLGVLLDLRIRQLTEGRKSLRDLFHWMNDNYARKGLFFPDSDGVQQGAETITGQSFAEFFHDFVAGVREIPYSEFFGFVGLQLAEATTRVATAGFDTTSFMGSQPEVIAVDAGSDAAKAGIRAGDRIVTMNGTAAPASFDDDVARMREGSTIKIRVANRRGQRDIKLKLTGRSEHVYILQDVPNITPVQRVHRTAWIHGNDESGDAP